MAELTGKTPDGAQTEPEGAKLPDGSAENVPSSEAPPVNPDTEQPNEETPESTPVSHTPPEQHRPWWQRPKKERQPEEPEEPEENLTKEEKLARNVAAAKERRINDLAEVIRTGARSPQELLDMVAELSFKDLKEIEEEAKYGKGPIGKARAFLAGEHDFIIDEKDATVRRGALGTINEAGRKILTTVFNRRTAVSAGVLLGLGLLTGGVGWAAGGVLLGGIAGRGMAELGESVLGKTRGAREEVFEAERERWEEMQRLTLEAQQSDDPIVKNNLARQITDLMYRQGDNALLQTLSEKERSLSAREEKFNKIRNRLQTAGELTGAVVGLTSILNGGVEHLDLDFWNKIDGQSVFHGVQQSQHGWNFLYSSAQEAARASMAGAHVIGGGHFGAHVLNAPTNWILGATIGERSAPMLIASMLAWNSERNGNPFNMKFGPEKVYQTRDKNGEVYYTRSNNGTYIRWERSVTEEKDKDGKVTGTKKDVKHELVAQKDLPEAVRRHFDKHAAKEIERERQANRVKEQIPTTREYLLDLADKNHTFLPENPRGYSYDWNEQPKVIDSLIGANIDRWHLYTYENGQEIPMMDKKTGKFIEVAVLGSDPDHNRIAYSVFERAPQNDATHIVVKVDRLDDFVSKYRLHLAPEKGSPIEDKDSQSDSPSPDNPDAPSPQVPKEPESTKSEPDSPDSPGGQKPDNSPPGDSEPEPGGEKLPPEGAADTPPEKAETGPLSAEREKAQRQSIVETLYNDMPFVKKELLKEAGIQEIETKIDRIDSQSYSQYRIIIHKKNGEKGVLTINLINHRPDGDSSEFTHMYPDDYKEERLERYEKEIPLDVLKAFADDLVNRLERAAKNLNKNEKAAAEQKVEEINQDVKEAEKAPGTEKPEVETSAAEKTEDGTIPIPIKKPESQPEVTPEQIKPGLNFKFNETFRHDAADNTVNLRAHLGSVFTGVEEKDRTRKLMDVVWTVQDITQAEGDNYNFKLAARQNGGLTDPVEFTYSIDDFAKFLTLQR